MADFFFIMSKVIKRIFYAKITLSKKHFRGDEGGGRPLHPPKSGPAYNVLGEIKEIIIIIYIEDISFHHF